MKPQDGKDNGAGCTCFVCTIPTVGAATCKATDSLQVERTGEVAKESLDVVSGLTCGNCGFEVDDNGRYTYHVKLCAIPV
jgi:hypothetical protein